MIDLCLESISFLEKIKHKIIISYNTIFPYPKKSVEPIEKVAPSEDVEKGSGALDDIEKPVFTGNNKITEELELKVCNKSVAPNIKKK